MNQCTAAAVSSTAQHAAHQILDLLIIGGGLSGTFLAHDYHHRHDVNDSRCASSPSWRLLEARSVLGGRLVNDVKDQKIDLGGAWVWPHHQPNLRHLLPQLNISTFPQPDDPSSTRIEGGAVALIHNLSSNLPPGNILLDTAATKCTWVDSEQEESYIQVETKYVAENVLQYADSSPAVSATTFRAKRVVIAVPPKLVSKHIQFDPPLSNAKQQAMGSSHTWMAGVTKVAVVYPTRFWKNTNLRTNMGLPAHLGPAFQVYDASTKDGSVAAITFFALVEPGSAALNDDKILAQQVTQQLANVWKYLEVDDKMIHELLHSYTDVHVQRWPMEEYISEDPEPRQIHPHPHPVRALSQSEWNGQLLFAGSESDLDSPGVMEGAIGAALRVLRDIP
jgi:monoamine oxidase